MRVAIVHYWFVGMRGGEKVIEALCELFPQADIFTHVYRADAVSPVIRRHKVRQKFSLVLHQLRRQIQDVIVHLRLSLTFILQLLRLLNK